MTRTMTKAGEGTKKEPTTIGSEKKFLRDKYSREIAHWEYIASACELTLKRFGPPQKGDNLQAFKDVNDFYQKATDRLEKARQKLREVEDSE